MPCMILSPQDVTSQLLCCRCFAVATSSSTNDSVHVPFQMRTELYFLSAQKNRPSLFGMPLIVPCTVHTSKKDLYDAVWIQVSRLASPLPPQESSNHAQDW